MGQEKKYKEALERARGIINYYKEHNRDEFSIEDLQEIFPELAESEDERIRTKLLNLLKELLELGGVAQETWSMNDCEQFIAWLEAQGEQKPQRMISAEAKEALFDTTIPFGASDSELIEETITIPEGCTAEIRDNNVVIIKKRFDYNHAIIRQKDYAEPPEGYTEFEWELHILYNTYIGNSFTQKREFDEMKDRLLTLARKQIASEIDADSISAKIKKIIKDNPDGAVAHLTASGAYRMGVEDVINSIKKGCNQRQSLKKAADEYVGHAEAFVKEQEQTPAWSEEDENVLEDIEEAIINYWHGDTQDILLDWLNSIKDRVQPKQEWSKEDNEYLEDTLTLLEGNCAKHTYGEVKNWLKSLKDRYTWKPSDEQIRALEFIDNTLNVSFFCNIVKGLLEQLKKLKGE